LCVDNSVTGHVSAVWRCYLFVSPIQRDEKVHVQNF